MKHELLTRDEFREGVFARDNNRCVVCKAPAADAHHILERRLWPDGGYYLANGASVCEEHHKQCESTLISVEDIRQYAGITKPIIPPHLYSDHVYDKWGNIVLPSGKRLKGELFYDESVQKILAPVLDTFTHYVKYPRTHHLPWSPGLTEDDRVIPTLDRFKDQRIIVTEKMDGENTTMYSDYIHARSIDGRSHSSRDWVKQFWAQRAADIPEGWRICGENLYAKHSIAYNDLPSYFVGFSIWNERNKCLSWTETLEWFQLLNIIPAKVLYDGIYDENILKNVWKPASWESIEGFVVRLESDFDYKDFRFCVAKFVRPNHIQSVKHWMHGQAIEPNQLRKS